MDAAISKVKLDEELARVRAADAIASYHAWTIIADGLVVYIPIKARVGSGKEYLARFNFDDFPQRAPSFTFVDPKAKKEGREFWPQHGAFAAALSRKPIGLCIAGVREFHEQLHREQPWDPCKYPFVKTLESIQAELNKENPLG